MNLKQLNTHYQTIRAVTEKLCAPLAIEDYVVQSVEEVSPPKWHLAHTTWFFETFILQHDKNYKVFDSNFHYLFNSYYQKIGEPYPRVQRGVLSRPTVEKVYAYRRYVDEAMLNYLEKLKDEALEKNFALIILGLEHEEQHQELLLMDIKHNFSYDPTFPAYLSDKNNDQASRHCKLDFHHFVGGVVKIGHQEKGFCFDNELPQHEQILKPYQLANRLVTNGEFIEFIEAKGYQQADWWLADGWEMVKKEKWKAPLYWQFIDNKWFVFTLKGLQPLKENEPLSHVSYYEADAYARWQKARLPSEAEWEHAARLQDAKIEGNFLESKLFHPALTQVKEDKIQQLFGDVWEWTMSPYTPYPGYVCAYGALGEYNGKFMSNQMVLRGGSCITPKAHVRSSYRNFFQPDKRWQFGGIRLAKNA